MVRTGRRGRPPHADILTPAEWKIVHLAQHGLSNRQMAHRRGISLDAVKFHLSNVIAKLGLQNKRALRNWFQEPKHSALNRRSEEMTDSLNGTIGQISRKVSDIDHSEAWYRDALGLPHLYRFGDLSFFDCNGTRLFLERLDAPLPEDSVIYFQVADIAHSYEMLKGRGIEFLSAPHMIHRHDNGVEEWMAFFNDPDGRPLAIMSQVGP